MNIRTLATLAVAIMLGLVAVVLVRGYLGSATKAKAGEITAAGGGVPVVVAAQPIERGVTLQPKLLKVVMYPPGSAPAAAFHTVAELNGPGAAARLALRSLAQDEPILPERVSGPGGKLNLSGTLTEGMRAVSIRSSDVVGVGGFIMPGDRVDVLVTRQTGGDEATTVTQALAENVRVLAIDQSDNEESNKPAVSRVVTVEATPDQAQTISLAQAVGTVSLTLRHVADAAALSRRATTVADLGFAPHHTAPAATPAAPPPVRPPGGQLTADNVARARQRLGPGQIEVKVTRGVETTGYAVSHF